jgi:hypothetical protein
LHLELSFNMKFGGETNIATIANVSVPFCFIKRDIQVFG